MSENHSNDNANDDANYMQTYRPWTNVVRGRSTCTTNIFHIQKELIDNNKPPINRDDIAQALHKRNLLRQTKVIQILSNIKYLSIQFETSQIMETFCTEPLTINDTYSTTFLPDFRKRTRKQIEPTYISFLNVPSEAEEDALTEFVEQHATVVGKPRYPRKKLGEIEYLTGTRVYRVHSIVQHIPRLISLFGRQIKCIYTNQPEITDNYRRNPTYNDDSTDTETESENDTHNQNNNENQNTNIENKQTQNKPQQNNEKKDTDTDFQIDSDTQSDIKTHNTEQNNRNGNKNHINTNQEINNQTNSKEKPYLDTNNKQSEKQNEKTPTNTKRQINQHLQNNQNNITNRRNQRVQKNPQNQEEYWIDNIPPELTEKNFPQIHQKDTLRQNDKQHNQEQQEHETTVIEETPESQLPQHNDKDLQFLSPPMVVTISTKTPQAINTSTPTIQTNPSTKPKQYNTSLLNPVLHNKGKIIPQEKIQERELKMTQKLAKFNYRDTGFLTNATTDERNQIIALSMYYQIGRYDPSNKFITTYSNKDILELYKQYTQKKLIKTNALITIYMYIYKIEQLMKLNKNNDKSKSNNKT